jgi:hypothetical protein
MNNGLASDANSLTINEPGQNLPAGAPSPNLQVIVTKSNIPYMFGRVIGLDTYKVVAAPWMRNRVVFQNRIDRAATHSRVRE